MIRKTFLTALLLSLVSASALVHAQTGTTQSDAQTPAPAVTAPAATAPAVAPTATSAKLVHTAADPGERAYNANCSRCHWAPEELSPHVSPTIVMHMRVRANLSAKDQQLILKYLAP